jgi:hypothetical protein
MAQIDSDLFQAPEINFLDVGRGRLQDHLPLQMLIQTVGVFAVTPVGGTAAGLDVGDLVRPRPKNAKKRLRAHSTGTHFNVIRQLDDTSARRPVVRQARHEFLKCLSRFHRFLPQRHRGTEKFLLRKPEGAN